MRRREFIMLLGGAAAAWPPAALAQQDQRVRRIGFLSPIAENDPEIRTLVREFTQRLQELGWTDGRNVRIDFRFGSADAVRLSMLATELVEEHPDAIVVIGSPAAAALRQQSLSLPIVFVQVIDPVSVGFVTNLARPEGNITGFTNFEFSIGGKWLQVLKQCAPTISRVAVIFDPANPSWTVFLRTIESAAPSIGVQLTPVGVRDAAEIKQRIAAFAREPNGAVVVLPSPVTSPLPSSICMRVPSFQTRSFSSIRSKKSGYAFKSAAEAAKTFDAMLNDPDIKDMFLMKYPVGAKRALHQKLISIQDVCGMRHFSKRCTATAGQKAL